MSTGAAAGHNSDSGAGTSNQGPELPSQGDLNSYAGPPPTAKRSLAAPIAVGVLALLLALLPLVFSYNWQGRFQPPLEGGPLIVAAHILDSAGDLPHAEAALAAAGTQAEALLREQGSGAPDEIRETAHAAQSYQRLIAARRDKAPGCVKDIQGELNNPMETRGRNRRLFRLGFCEELRGNNEAALKAYDGSIDLKPKVPVVYLHRALLRERTGNLVGARADFATALEIDPDYPSALLLGALFALRHNDPAGAQKLTERLRPLRKPYAELIDSVRSGQLTLPPAASAGGTGGKKP